KGERDRQDRYRTRLGDLAHSLKTPLAVLSSTLQEQAAGATPDERHLREMQEQVTHMDQIISWQLKRAVKSNNSRLLARPVAVAPVLRRLLDALGKVYRDKQMQVGTE